MERVNTSDSEETSASPQAAASSDGVGKPVARGLQGGSGRGRDSSRRASGRGARGRSSKSAEQGGGLPDEQADVVQGGGRGARGQTQFPPLRAHREIRRVMTSDEEESDSSSAEVSPESARIQAAMAVRLGRGGKKDAEKGKGRGRGGKKDAEKGKGRGRAHVTIGTSSDEDVSSPNVAKTMPKSSGLLDYVSWAVNTVLTEAERDALTVLSPVPVGSMCSGMGTEDMACQAIEAAMLEAGKGKFSAHSAFKAESDPHKVAFLQRHVRSSSTEIFDSNAALQHTEVQTVSGDIVPRPTCKVLAAGIVCIDISGLTTTPKPVSGDGKSGLALRGLLDSLRSMSFEERPAVIILECVAALAHHRKVDTDARTGAQYILDILLTLGYVGEWRTVRPRNFYLPQSRDRAYSLNLKRLDFSDAGARERRRDLDRAWKILLRMQVQSAEPLERLLQRVPSKESILRKRRGQPIEPARRAGQKWPQAHDDFADSAGLSEEARQPPADFVKELSPLVNPRAMHALWLKMAQLQKRKQMDWKHSLLIVPTGMTVSWGSIRTCFPCVTPSMEYLILERGARK
jgi:site-specific DNA-cytosine methylase